MQSSERWVILRNGEFHLARKKGDTWLTTKRSWPSLSTAKRAAEDIGQSISFQGAEVAEKDLHFFLNFGGGGHTWYTVRQYIPESIQGAPRSAGVRLRRVYLSITFD